ncbi:MAG: GGDEF domain-containing protein [Natronospirillum sp.]|uniref:GGDEF domain-containing protein n=1 Tax=Natronospirillum sp. TaxID=2812955 RepID=UPI0025E5AC6D|nr:GGDEF domain-containing protein [Natronospirillum sp.]MCH8552538.1 GGDEF domain-containing protein [Natronospirillum sp.]
MRWFSSPQLIRSVRRSERQGFHRWFRSINTVRTRVVGLVLLSFAVVWFALTLVGVESLPLSVYLAFIGGLMAGLALIHLGHKRDNDSIRYLGEFLILSVAVIWMFLAVAGNLETAYGLTELIIGTLALAMLRFMTPTRAALVFALIALGYAVVLWGHDALAIGPVNNGLLFCIFAYIWSVGTYNSKVLEYRNRTLVSQLNRQNRELTSLALHDSLTGLPNRRYFDQLMERHWQDRSKQQKPVALLLLDIDHFKHFNDSHGHPAGDQCLRDLAELLTSILRQEGTALRLGGEEFAIFLPECGPREAAVVAERLRSVIQERKQITVSIGLATAIPKEKAAQTLYTESDKALYAAKHGGRNQVVAAGEATSQPAEPPLEEPENATPAEG